MILSPHAFLLTLDGEPYQIRHVEERVTGATRESIGVDVRPDELYAIADRTGQRALLDWALDSAIWAERFGASARDVERGMDAAEIAADNPWESDEEERGAA